MSLISYSCNNSHKKSLEESAKTEQAQKDRDYEENRKWHYSEDKDQMRGRITKKAMVISINGFKLSFPYDKEETYLAVSLMKHSDNKETYLHMLLSQGQISPCFENCTIFAKFGNNKPIEFLYENAPENAKALSINLYSAEKFIKNLKTAKNFIIEVPIFQEGSKQFVFEVSEPFIQK